MVRNQQGWGATGSQGGESGLIRPDYAARAALKVRISPFYSVGRFRQVEATFDAFHAGRQFVQGDLLANVGFIAL